MRMPVMLFVGKQDTLSWEVGDAHAMMRSEMAMFDILGGHEGHVRMVILNESGHFPYREHPTAVRGGGGLVSFVSGREFYKTK